ncbi:MAG TPA: hypothetical protein VF801_13785 [Rhodocyclaceae bacterium]
MTTVSSTSSALLQSLAANGSASSSGTENSLLAALGSAPDAAATTDNGLLQTLVTLSSANGASGASAVQTYNAQGLLNQVQATMPEDPLFASDSGGNDPNGNSLLGGILDPGQSSGGSAADASGGSSSAGLLQLFQQSPTLAAAYVNGEVTQSLFSDMA